VPEFIQYFTSDVIEVVHSSVVAKKPAHKKTLKQVLAQLPLKENDIMKCLYHMLSSQDHPYGMIISDFGRRMEKSHENGEDMEQVLAEARGTLDTFSQSIADTIKSEEISLNVAPFDFSSICLDACYESICSREPPVILSFYHRKYAEKDKALYAKCEKLGTSITPAQANVQEKFCLQETEGGNNVPFFKAIFIFKKFTHKKTPHSKIQVLRDTVQSICHDTGQSVDLAHPVTADDLMAILTYVVLKSKIRTLFSESEFIHDFLGKQHLSGMHGYLVTTLQCCCMHVLSSHELVEVTENVKLPTPSPSPSPTPTPASTA